MMIGFSIDVCVFVCMCGTFIENNSFFGASFIIFNLLYGLLVDDPRADDF